MAITLDCPDADKIFSGIFSTSRKNHLPENFLTEYVFSDMSSLEAFFIWDPETKKLIKTSITSVLYPVFFENKEYQIAVSFFKDNAHPKVYSRNKLTTRFLKVEMPMDGPPFIYGNIRFENGTGKFELIIDYQDGITGKTVVFKFESFPVKLDYKRGFQMMARDIEAVYPRLVLDYMKKTFHNFKSHPGPYTHQIWWAMFENVYRSLLNNLHIIVQHKYSSNGRARIFKRDESIENATDYFYDKIERYSEHTNRFYEVSASKRMLDNYENQVVKFILKDITQKFDEIYSKVKGSDAGKRMSSDYEAQLDFVSKELTSLYEHSLFRSLSDITKIDEMSPVLVHKDGYTGLIQDWNKLNDGYRLFEGFYEIELKDTAYLYQIWCFFGLRNLIKDLGGKEEIIKVPRIIPDQFILSPTRDMNSKIIFKFDDGSIVELYHELLYNKKFDKDNAGTVTGDEKPDIVLRVWKNGLPPDMYLTYLFDAKYKINDYDRPERDDMDTMHRYRDAIYYKQKFSDRLSKEVIGAYVLYPGVSTIHEYEETIGKINIGGLPLYPGIDIGPSLIKHHLSYIFNTDVSTLLNAVHDFKWKGYEYEETNVFIAYLKRGDIKEIFYLENTASPQFIMKKFPSAPGALKHFALYIEGEGMKYVWNIEDVQQKARREVFPANHELYKDDSRKCFVLKLGNKYELEHPLHIKGIKRDRYTKLKYIDNPVNGFIKTISETKTRIRNQEQ